MEGHTIAASIVEMKAARLGISDPTRRWALLGPDGEAYFPGITRPEGVALGDLLAGEPVEAWADRLVEIKLPAILTDGAGPHLLASDGSLVVVLGPHDQIAGASVAMGIPNPRHLVGVVEPLGSTDWRWICCGEVETERQIDALDELSRVDRESLDGWSLRWAGIR